MKDSLGVLFLIAIIFSGVYVLATQISDEFEYKTGLYTNGPYMEASDK